MRLFLLPLVLLALTGADVEEAIMGHLKANYPVDGAKYVCDFSRLDLDQLAEFDSVAVDGYGKDIPGGNVIVRLSFFQNGERTYRTAGTIKVGILKPVLTAAVSIKAGEAVDSSKVILQLRDISSLDESTFEYMGQLGDVVASKFIPAGRIITGSSISEPPVVNIGDVVEIRYSKGPLLLHTNGIIKRAGAVGSDVRVMNVDTGKIISATVVDSATVVIAHREEM
jgi:flagella basal body P-ring formation protein FlgA